jgi:DNA-binding SARP family transcriptional activator
MTDPVIPAKTRVPSLGGLDRARLDALLRRAWDRPLTLVVAPAGSGKTTLLSAFARRLSSGDGDGDGRRLAWYQAAGSEADPKALLRHLEETLRQAMPGLPGGWSSVGAAAAALETWDGAPVTLVVDDAHTLAATGAEAALDQLITYLPPRLHVILSSRRRPTFDLSRWRLADQLGEIGPDDLRFRSWEVEELFVQHYHQRLRPEDLAELARRTDGWAAGLALFHLATRNKTPIERRRVLDSLSARQRDTRDYLTRNVLAELDDDRRDFLIRSSVLGRLSGPWCDALLGRADSAGILSELERRHLFLVSDDGGTTYRQHEVLRAHLEELLVERIGEAGTRRLYQQAGPILEAGGAETEALRAYCRAQDWVAADRLLGRSGDRVFDPFGGWVEPLPPALADHDAWLLLATARRQVRSGHWPAALASYRRAESVAIGALVARTCGEERLQLVGWMDPVNAVAHAWTGLLRQALERDPLVAADQLVRMATAGAEDSTGVGSTALHLLLAGGLAAVAAGHLRRASSIFAEAADDADSVLGRWGTFAGTVVSRILSEADGDLPAALDALDPIVPPWLGRLLRHLLDGPAAALSTQVAAAQAGARATDNRWIDLALSLLQGFGQMVAGEAAAAVGSFDEADSTARALGAPVIAAWAAAAGALAAAAAGDRVGGAARGVAANRSAHAVGCPGAAALALLVVAAVGPAPRWEEAARSLEAEGVVHLAGVVARVLGRDAVTSGTVEEAGSTAGRDDAETGPPGGTSAGRHGSRTRAELVLASTVPFPSVSLPARVFPVPPVVDVRCLGAFELVVDGAVVDVRGAKPRLRSLLFRLALEADRGVHRDQLRAALWPRDDPRTGTRNLQVAISALRQLLECEAGAGSIVARRGDSYALELGGGGGDLGAFEGLVERGRRARRSGERDAALSALGRALEMYRGDLLADEGLAEWVLDERERFRLVAADAAQQLAECHLEGGDIDATVGVAERGVGIDRYNDRLWRVLIEAHERSGNRAAAARSAQSYALVLDELGVVEAVAAHS